MARQIRSYRVLRDVTIAKPLQLEISGDPEFRKQLEANKQKARASGPMFRRVFGRA